MLHRCEPQFSRNECKLHALTLTVLILTCLLLVGTLSPLWAQVTTTQSTVNFGSVAVGAGRRQGLSFAIPSGITLGGVSAVTQGAQDLDYTVGPASTCASGTTNSTCVLQVRFRPTTVGSRVGAVVLTDEGGNTLITVPLSGIGTGPRVAFGPGIISTYAGEYEFSVLNDSGTGGYSGDGGPATSAQLNYPWGVTLDGSGNLYIADWQNHVIRKVSATGTISTVAGNYSLGAGYSGDGGPATSAQLSYPESVAVDGGGNLYIADSDNQTVRKVTPDGIITPVAGNYALGAGYSGDGGPATSAQLRYPWSVAVDGTGNLYISDAGNNVVRKVTPAGIISTVAGNYARGSGYSGDGGPATSAQINFPYGIAVDGSGDLYIADTFNNVVREVNQSGIITTVAGNGTKSLTIESGPATSVALDEPAGVAVDGAGNFYIADSNKMVIEKVTPGGMLTTVAGDGPFLGYGGDGGPATSASFDEPLSVAVDGEGNLYIADSGNSLIRKVDVSDPPSLTFANTTVGEASAPQNITVLNLGNAPLDLDHISVSDNFSLGGSSTSCSGRGQTLNAGESCVLGIEFIPEQAGSIQGSVVLADSSLNASKAFQFIALQGTASAPVLAPTVTVLTALPGSVDFGGTVTLTASVSSTTAGEITGNVTFQVGGKNLGKAAISAGTATLQNVSVRTDKGFSVGSDTVTAIFGGDTGFTASSGSATLTVERKP
jgi:hypothetical protein